uniref:hypothetical protein n=1 Tax=Trichocoleus desertorum TaxID=1481672 RepID=UPI0025B5BFB6|nr:hypothetical protein [Trichocoleus desertorum]
MISVSSRKVTKFLAFVVLGLLSFSLLGQLSKVMWGGEHPWIASLAHVFDIDREKNLPSLYSAATLFICACLLAVIATVKHQKRDRYVGHWGCLSFIFLFLAADEWTSLHEKTIEPLRALLGSNGGGALHFAWVLPGALFVGLVAIAYLKFLRDLPTRTKRLLLTAGALFVAGTLGMEMIDGAYAHQYGLAIWNREGLKPTWEALVYTLMMTCEEGLEMAGVLVFMYALISYLGDCIQEIRIRIDPNSHPILSDVVAEAAIPNRGRV